MTLRIIILCSLFALSTVAQAKEKESLGHCKSLHSSIKNIEQQRRKGGSAKKMEGLRDRLREVKEEYSDGNCRAWGRQLR